MKFKLQKFEDTCGNTFWRICSKSYWFMPWTCDSGLNYFTKCEAEHEGIIFLDKYSTIDNEGYLQYRLRYLLSRYEDIKNEEI